MNPLLAETLNWVRSSKPAVDEREAQSAQKRQDAAMVRRVLISEDGEAFLMLLARLSVLRPALDPALHGPASHDYAQRRTGANSVFAAVVHYLDLSDLNEGTTHDRPRSPDHAALADAGYALWDARATDAGWDDAGTVAGP